MQDVLIYEGIGINIVPALFLMAYAMKYAYDIKTAYVPRRYISRFML